MNDTNPGEHLDGVLLGADPARVERVVVEDLDTVNLSQNLETLQTSGVVLLSRDSAGGRARRQEGGRVEFMFMAVLRAAADGRARECADAGPGSARSQRGGANGGAEHV